MAISESEKAIKKLESKIAELEDRIARQEDIEEVRNLMGKYEVWHVPNKVTDTWQLFAMKTPDVSAEIADWGVYVGPEKIKRFYNEVHRVPYKGTMHEHYLTTYVIQVAKDGKTAKGVFFSPGHESWKNKKDERFATWVWGKYGVDFIKEEGVWKIWHLHWYTSMRSDFYKSWQEPCFIPGLEFEQEAKVPADLPTTYHKPYGLNTEMDVVPPYPEPYETWDEFSVARGPKG